MRYLFFGLLICGSLGAMSGGSDAVDRRVDQFITYITPSPLMEHVRQGDREAVGRLLSGRRALEADESRDLVFTALTIEDKSTRINMLKRLLYANCSVKGQITSKLLLMARLRGCPEWREQLKERVRPMVAYLFSQGQDASDDVLVQQLFEYSWGAAQEFVDEEESTEEVPALGFGITPLGYAASAGMVDELCLLLAYGADQNGASAYKNTPLHHAMQAYRTFQYPIKDFGRGVDQETTKHSLIALMLKGARPDCIDGMGRLPHELVEDRVTQKLLTDFATYQEEHRAECQHIAQKLDEQEKWRKFRQDARRYGFFNVLYGLRGIPTMQWLLLARNQLQQALTESDHTPASRKRKREALAGESK